jgi:hypothetical protein
VTLTYYLRISKNHLILLKNNLSEVGSSDQIGKKI